MDAIENRPSSFDASTPILNSDSGKLDDSIPTMGLAAFTAGVESSKDADCQDDISNETGVIDSPVNQGAGASLSPSIDSLSPLTSPSRPKLADSFPRRLSNSQLPPNLASPRRFSTGTISEALNPVVPKLLPLVRRVLRTTNDGLSRFVMALDSRRGEGTVLSRPSLDALTVVMLTALDVADARADFARGRALMVMSQTFFAYITPEDDVDELDPAVAAALEDDSLEDEGVGHRIASFMSGIRHSTHKHADDHEHAGTIPRSRVLMASGILPGGRTTQRLYLQARVRSHRLWQNQQFWESAVYETLGLEFSKVSMYEAKSSENVRSGREREVSLGQLGFFAYNMIAFNVSVTEVRRLLDKYAKFIRLADAEWNSLLASVDAFALEHSKTIETEHAARVERRAARERYAGKLQTL
jgi:hypothetical protein